MTGEAENDAAGISVNSAGDVNNDGYDDLLVGAYVNDDAAEDAGSAYVVYAQPSAVTITTDTTEVNTLECGVDTFTDPGATATDQYTNTSLTVSTVDAIANTPAGTDTVTYTTASNTLNITGSATRTVTISDTVVPVLTLVGDAAVSVQQDATYTDTGVTVTETCHNSLTATTTGSVNTAVPGDYTLTYNATDASGNVATTVSRIVTVVAATTEEDTEGDIDEDSTHGVIITATKSGGSIDLVYSDDFTESITPFNGSRQFDFTMTTDELGIVATNGKLVRVFMDGVKIDQKKINKKTLRSKYITLKVKQLYATKSYSDIMIMLAKKNTGKVSHLRLTSTNSLTKFTHKQVAIHDRRPSTITVKVTKHRFITRIGNGTKKTKSVWKVTRRGILKSVR